jgi:DNA-directed RNA polymerase subunit omega
MTIPLDLLLDREGNVYEMTCASVRRAAQLTVTGDEEIESGGKVVSLAIKQILTDTVEYRIEE